MKYKVVRVSKRGQAGWEAFFAHCKLTYYNISLTAERPIKVGVDMQHKVKPVPPSFAYWVAIKGGEGEI